MIEFADLSSYQAGADLAAYAAAGHDRVLLKATEGTGYTNPHFAGWWAAAGRLGLARGAYHYAKPSAGRAPADEVRHFLAAVQAAGGLGPRDWLCLDVEDPAAKASSGGRHAADLAAALADAGHPAGLIYTGTWWARPAGLTAATLPPGWRRLHLADYGRGADDAVPLPPGWDRGQVVARQYTSGARQAGIPGGSDRSRVLRDWLPIPTTVEAPVTDVVLTPAQLEAVADTVLARGWEQATERPPGAAPDWYPPRQAHIGGLWRRTYEMVGQALALLTSVLTEVRAVRTALATMVDPSHPAAAILTDPSAAAATPTVDDLVAAAGRLDLADAVRLAGAASARAAALIPASNHPEETP